MVAPALLVSEVLRQLDSACDLVEPLILVVLTSVSWVLLLIFVQVQVLSLIQAINKVGTNTAKTIFFMVFVLKQKLPTTMGSFCKMVVVRLPLTQS